MKKVQGMYFSGTGTTEKIVCHVAAEIARGLEKDGYTKEEDINITPREERQKEHTFNKYDVVVFGTPVIAGRVPNVLLKFLDTIQGGGAMAVPVVLYGNRNYDDGLIELRNILENRGFHTVAAAAFIGEHSFSKILAKGRPDAEDMERATDFAREAASKINALWAFSGRDDAKLEKKLKEQGAIAVSGQDSIRDYYKPQDRNGKHINILKVKPKLDESKCDKCGKCVEACPMGSIKPEAPGVVEGICIKCCGCEKKCPNGALYFDDPGYLYHKEELEYLYAGKRREPETFL